MFRPQVVDRVLGLLGVQNRETSSHVATEWDSVTTDTSQENESLTFGNVFAFDNASFGDNSDGFAVASPLQATTPAMPMQTQLPVFETPPLDSGQYGNVHGFIADIPAVFDEGVAVSGANGGRGAMPDFSGYPAVSLTPQSPGFEGFSPIASNTEPASGASEIAIQFGGSASSNASPNPTVANDHPAGTGFAQPLPFPQQPPHQTVNDNTVGFANFPTPTQPDMSMGVDTILPTSSSGNTGFGGNVPMPEASIVMPDPQYGGFSDYRPQMTVEELDARIVPPAEAPVIAWETPNNSQTGGMSPASGIAQPFMTPEQFSPENAVIPVQGTVVPTTPLYIPPQGSPVLQPMQQTQPLPQMIQPSPSVTSQPIAPSAPLMPQFQTSQHVPPQSAVLQPLPEPQVSQSQPESQQPVAIANATRHDLPVIDRRAQYEPEVITESETVFATEMLARVGSKKVILTCDILAEVREIIDNEWAVQYRKSCEEYGQKPTLMDERNFKAEVTQLLFEQTLNNWIMLQMLYVDMTLNVPAEQIEEIKKAEAKNFDMETLPKMMEQYGVTNRYDLNEELRKYGTTLEHLKESTIEKRLAQGWFGETVKRQKIIPSRDDMIAYYEQHKEEKYKIPGQAKWEELAVFFSETANEQEARAKIAELGNRVQKGEPFAEVAKQGSQGLTAWRGGERETTVGSLRTKKLEQAVFTLPVGSMSTIITEDTGGNNAGYYIVRVTERRDTHYTPFDRVQGEIQKAIHDERSQKEQERLFAEIQRRVPVKKTPNLQQIITMASEAERNLPIDDTPERQAQLIAKAERLDPGKKDRNDNQGQTVVAAGSPPPSNAAVRADEPDNRVALAHSRTETQNIPPLSREKEEPPKKKSFLQTLNPFK